MDRAWKGSELVTGGKKEENDEQVRKVEGGNLDVTVL
jgi:hypothetical protein